MNTQKKPPKPIKPYGFDLNVQHRLRHYRQLDAHHKEHYPHQANESATWRHYRYVKPEWLKTQFPPTQVTRPDDADYWCCEQFPFKVLGYADELNRHLKHQGWFTDNHCGETYRGVVLVARLHGKFGFIPAVTHSDWDGKLLWIGDFEPLEDQKNWGNEGFRYSSACRRVASLADDYAEHLAEEAREADAKDQAEQEMVRLAEERSELRQEALALIKEIKAAKRQFTPAICMVLVEKLKAIQRSIQRKRERSAALADDYWLTVSE